MKIAIDVSTSKEILKSRLFLEEPVFSVLSDPETRTSVKILRDDDSEFITFKSQGEILAALVRPPGASSSVLEIIGPSPGIDLYLFWDILQSFYEEIPELEKYIRGGFNTSREKAFDGLSEESDRCIYAAIMNLGWHFELEGATGKEN